MLISQMTRLCDASGQGALKPALSNRGPWSDMDDWPKRHLRHGEPQTWPCRCQLPEFLGRTLYMFAKEVRCLVELLYAVPGAFFRFCRGFVERPPGPTKTVVLGESSSPRGQEAAMLTERRTFLLAAGSQAAYKDHRFRPPIAIPAARRNFGFGACSLN